jgi:hypothetical protein
MNHSKQINNLINKYKNGKLKAHTLIDKVMWILDCSDETACFEIANIKGFNGSYDRLWSEYKRKAYIYE